MVSGNRHRLVLELESKEILGEGTHHVLPQLSGKGPIINARTCQLSTLLLEAEYFQLWETCWQWIFVFSCNHHVGATEPGQIL